jgi:hypothetical protein
MEEKAPPKQNFFFISSSSSSLGVHKDPVKPPIKIPSYSSFFFFFLFRFSCEALAASEKENRIASGVICTLQG